MSNTEIHTIRYPFYSGDRIKNAVKYVADRINNDWGDYTEKCGYGHPLYVCLLNGGAPFFHDLIKHLEPGYVAYVKAKSYGSSQVPGASTDVKIDMVSIPDDCDVNRILIIDDICDSGKTLSAVAEKFEQMVASIKRKDHITIPVECCVLLNRITDPNSPNPNYSAIEVNNNYFFAGYGLDDDGLMRNLPYIYVCGIGEDNES